MRRHPQIGGSPLLDAGCLSRGRGLGDVHLALTSEKPLKKNERKKQDPEVWLGGCPTG